MRSSVHDIVRRIAAILLTILIAGLVEDGYAAETERAVPGEYQVKAAFVYNFIKFVEWPADRAPAAGDVRLCVLGKVPVMASFEELRGQEVAGRRLIVTELQELNGAGACQVLFVAPSLSRRLPDVLAAVAGRPVLTIGDTDGYAEKGIMINMYLENKRVRFEINASAARAAGLGISAKLMGLAVSVYGEQAEE
jgi:hypothetical protein